MFGLLSGRLEQAQDGASVYIVDKPKRMSCISGGTVKPWAGTYVMLTQMEFHSRRFSKLGITVKENPNVFGAQARFLKASRLKTFHPSLP